MPAESNAQRKMIFARRKQYGSKEKTPKNWRWIWESGWEQLTPGAPEKVNEESEVTQSKFKTYLEKIKKDK